MRNNAAIGYIVPGMAAAFASASNDTLGNLKSTLFTETNWLDYPSSRNVLRSSTFDLRDLKRREDVVFSFVVSVLALRGPLAPLARFIINITALVFEHFDEKKGQCLMVCDELPSMGNNKMIEILLPVFRSYGICFIGISQDIQLLKNAYPKTWRSFIGNADFVIWMATNEDETKEYLSGVLGKTTSIEKDKFTGRKTRSIVDVRSAEQIGRLLEPDSGRMIVTQAGNRPKILGDDPYYKALSVWEYAADPNHREAFLRRITRFFFDRVSSKVVEQPIPEPDDIPIETEPEATPHIESENVIPFPNQDTTGDTK